MSRRAATFTQADVARALRAAQQVGPDWQIVVESGAIRIFRGETKPPSSATVEEPAPREEEEPVVDWKF
jgi:hypothetical protein